MISQALLVTVVEYPDIAGLALVFPGTIGPYKPYRHISLPVHPKTWGVQLKGSRGKKHGNFGQTHNFSSESLRVTTGPLNWGGLKRKEKIGFHGSFQLQIYRNH